MAGNPLIQNITNAEKRDSRFGQFGAGGAYGGAQSTQYAQAQYNQQYGNYSAAPNTQFGQQNPSAHDLNSMYNAPAAGPAQTGQLTINDVIVKTGLNLAIVVVGAALGWFMPILMFLGVIGGLVFGLINSFKKKVSPALVMLYSLFEGMALGGISMFFEAQYAGIVGQAVLATLIVFATMLFLFRSGRIRESAKATKIFMGALIAYMIFGLVNMGMMMFGGMNMRSAEIFGIPLGLIVGLIAIVMGAYSLVMDFTNIGEAVRFGAPERESWRLAFGLVVTLVWLYLEILRVIYYARSLADD